MYEPGMKEDIFVQRILSNSYTDETKSHSCLRDIIQTPVPIDNIESLIRAVHDHIPITSLEYTRIMEDIREYFDYVYDNEYVLAIQKMNCLPNSDDFKFFEGYGYYNINPLTTTDYDNYGSIINRVNYQLKYMLRSHAEWNPQYIHFVVGGLIHTADDHYVVLKRKYGQFKDKYTLVQGHCSYTSSTWPKFYRAKSLLPNNLSQEAFKYLYEMDLKREILEEVGCLGCTVHQDMYMYKMPTFITPADLSYYHAGFLFYVTSDYHDKDFTPGEPDRNEIVFMTKDELLNLKMCQTDLWLHEFANRFDDQI